MVSKSLKARLSILGFSSLLLITGCGSQTASTTTSNSASTTKSTGSSASKPTVVIGYENAPDPEAVAIEQKFFQKYMHANVKLKYYSSGPNALASLASGSLQFMTTLGNPPVVSAISRGVPLQVIWAMERYTTGEGLVVRKGKGIKSIKNLKGHHVALVQGSTSPFELSAAEKAAGLSSNAIAQRGMSPASMVAAWKKGQINAAWVWVPFFTAMVKDHGKALLYDQNQAKSAPIFNLAVVNSTWAKAHPSLVDGFIKAENAGYQFFKKHPNQSYKDMGKLNGISASEAKSQASGLSFTSLKKELSVSRLGTPSTVKSSLVTKSLTSAATWLKASGAIRKVPSNLSKYVNPTYVEQVTKGK